jgi:hypothetical protein
MYKFNTSHGWTFKWISHFEIPDLFFHFVGVLLDKQMKSSSRITKKKLKICYLSDCGRAIYIKEYLKAKEELRKFKYFTMRKYNLKKKIL